MSSTEWAMLRVTSSLRQQRDYFPSAAITKTRVSLTEHKPKKINNSIK